MKHSKLFQVFTKYQSAKKMTQEVEHPNFFIFGKEDKFEIDIANDLKTKIEAYQLIYRLYRSPEMDYTAEDPSQMWYSLFNADPNTKTLVVKDFLSKKVVATLTIVFDSALGIPLEENYPDQITEFRKRKRVCAEIISLGFNEMAKGSSEILIELFKHAYLIARSIYSVTDFLIMVKPRHAFFYERKLLFKVIGEEVNCTKINNKPVKLYHLDLIRAQAQAEIYIDNIIIKNHCEEIYKSFVQAQNCKELIADLKNKVVNIEMTCSDLEYLFMQKKNIFKKVSHEQLIKLSRIYKNEKAKLFLKNCTYYQFSEIARTSSNLISIYPFDNLLVVIKQFLWKLFRKHSLINVY